MNLPANAWIQKWWENLLELGTRKPERWPQTRNRLLEGEKIMQAWSDADKREGYLYLFLSEVGWYLQGTDADLITRDELYGKAQKLFGGAADTLKPPSSKTLQMLRSLKEHHEVEPTRK